jgi:hypothetical protein
MSQLVIELDERQVDLQEDTEPELTFKNHFPPPELPEMVKHEPVQLFYKSESDKIPHYAVEIRNPTLRKTKDPYNLSLYRSDYKTSKGMEIPFVKIALVSDKDGNVKDIHNIGPLEMNYAVPGEKDTFITLQYRKNGTPSTVVLDQVIKRQYHKDHFVEVLGVSHNQDDPLFKQGRYLSMRLDYIDWKATAGQYLNGHHNFGKEKVPCQAETLHQMPVVAAHTSTLWR